MCMGDLMRDRDVRTAQCGLLWLALHSGRDEIPSARLKTRR
jgi:hypothetical protein